MLLVALKTSPGPSEGSFLVVGSPGPTTAHNRAAPLARLVPSATSIHFTRSNNVRAFARANSFKESLISRNELISLQEYPGHEPWFNGPADDEEGPQIRPVRPRLKYRRATRDLPI